MNLRHEIHAVETICIEVYCQLKILKMGSVHICTCTEKPGNPLISLKVEMLSIVSYFYGMLIS